MSRLPLVYLHCTFVMTDVKNNLHFWTYGKNNTQSTYKENLLQHTIVMSENSHALMNAKIIIMRYHLQAKFSSSNLSIFSPSEWSHGKWQPACNAVWLQWQVGRWVRTYRLLVRAEALWSFLRNKHKLKGICFIWKSRAYAKRKCAKWCDFR